MATSKAKTTVSQNDKAQASAIDKAVAALRAPVAAFVSSTAKEDAAKTALATATTARQNTQLVLGETVGKVTKSREVAITALNTLLLPYYVTDAFKAAVKNDEDKIKGKTLYVKGLAGKIADYGLGSEAKPGGMSNPQIKAMVERAAPGVTVDQKRAVCIGNAKINAKGEFVRVVKDARGGSRSALTPLETFQAKLALAFTFDKKSLKPLAIVEALEQVLLEAGLNGKIEVREV